jgi:hypothetical protein
LLQRRRERWPWSLPRQRLTGSVGQLGCDLVELLLGGEFEIGSAFREVLTQQAVGVFVRTRCQGECGSAK